MGDVVRQVSVREWFNGSACVAKLEYFSAMFNYGRAALESEDGVCRSKEYMTVDHALEALSECPIDSECGERLLEIWGETESNLEKQAHTSLAMLEQGVHNGEDAFRCESRMLLEAINKTNTIYWG